MKRIGIIAAALCTLTIIAIGCEVLTRGGRAQRLPAAGSARAAAVSPMPATVDKEAYDAKMLALANLAPRAGCPPTTDAVPTDLAPAKATESAPEPKRVALVRADASPRPCRKPLWPPHDTVYPEAGALLPFKRIVAYYGNFYSPRMGILGQYPPDKILAMLSSQAAEWVKADPSTPVTPAIDYIVVAAQDVPGPKGEYMLRMPPEQIEKALNMADQIHGLLFLDVQPGWSTVQIEVTRLAQYLKLPNVELALDPEFALTPGKRPGEWRGAMSAADINWAARFLAKLVQRDHLPPKILVIHRFTEGMVTDFRAIKPLPEVEIVMDMDGFGSPVLKVATYKDFIASQPVQFTGFKLFYLNDVKYGGRLMTPAQVLRLSPQPIFILYQ